MTRSAICVGACGLQAPRALPHVANDIGEGGGAGDGLMRRYRWRVTRRGSGKPTWAGTVQSLGNVLSGGQLGLARVGGVTEAKCI